MAGRRRMSPTDIIMVCSFVSLIFSLAMTLDAHRRINIAQRHIDEAQRLIDERQQPRAPRARKGLR